MKVTVTPEGSPVVNEVLLQPVSPAMAQVRITKDVVTLSYEWENEDTFSSIAFTSLTGNEEDSTSTTTVTLTSPGEGLWPWTITEVEDTTRETLITLVNYAEMPDEVVLYEGPGLEG